MELSGKVALITGGTSGIGLAVAKNLIQSGASRVIVAGRDVQTGAQAVKVLNELCDADQKAEFVPTDITAGNQLKGKRKSIGEGADPRGRMPPSSQITHKAFSIIIKRRGGFIIFI